jgi:hypothetical protein
LLRETTFRGRERAAPHMGFPVGPSRSSALKAGDLVLWTPSWVVFFGGSWVLQGAEQHPSPHPLYARSSPP